MTAPTTSAKTPPAKTPSARDPHPIQNGASKPFGAPAPPDHRTTALQSAVAVLRGRTVVKTEDVLDMAEAFHEFLSRSEPARKPTAELGL